jgi:hypothetical protein
MFLVTGHHAMLLLDAKDTNHACNKHVTGCPHCFDPLVIRLRYACDTLVLRFDKAHSPFLKPPHLVPHGLTVFWVMWEHGPATSTSTDAAVKEGTAG